MYISFKTVNSHVYHWIVKRQNTAESLCYQQHLILSSREAILYSGGRGRAARSPAKGGGGAAVLRRLQSMPHPWKTEMEDCSEHLNIFPMSLQKIRKQPTRRQEGKRTSLRLPIGTTYTNTKGRPTNDST